MSSEANDDLIFRALAAPVRRQILDALRRGFSDGQCAEEIAEMTGLTVVQIDRRTIELQRKGLIRVRQYRGADEIRHGMRVWEAV